jgi:hypothetical protein
VGSNGEDEGGEHMEQDRSIVREMLNKIIGIKAEAEIWTLRMLTAQVFGDKGGNWFSLIDKVYRPETLRWAWEVVRRNKSAAGVDRVREHIADNRLLSLIGKLAAPRHHDRTEKLATDVRDSARIRHYSVAS